jgi:hypothetical protein
VRAGATVDPVLLFALAAAGHLVASGGSRLPAANVAEACQWPTVVAFRAGRDKCTGVLVEPRHVLTAAHCLRGGIPDRVRFGESFQPYARVVDVEMCVVDPAFADSDAPGDDLAACRLVEPVLDVPPTPVLPACEAEAVLRVGTDVALVGFGIPEAGGLFGDKRYAFTRVADDVRDDDTFVAGDAEVGGCDGDSGGPAFVRRADGTWHVAGILVAGPACGEGASRYLAPSRRLSWLEQQLGVALGSCDADEDCGVALDPLAVGATWDEGCPGPTRIPRDGCEAAPSDASGDGATTTGDADPVDPSSSSGHDAAASPAAAGDGCRIAVAPQGWPGLVVLVALIRRRRRGRGRSGPPRAAAHRARAPARSPASSTRSRG